MQVEITHLFSITKCIQTGHPYRLSVAQKTKLGLTDSLNTSNGNSKRSSARTGDTVSCNRLMLKKWKNPGVSMAPIQQPTRT